MADDGTLQQLAQAVTNALQPLQARLAAGDARTLLAEMGLSLPPSLDGLTTFSTATSAATGSTTSRAKRHTKYIATTAQSGPSR